MWATWRCAARVVVCGGLIICGVCGCKRKPPLPEVYLNRANDATYVEQLQEMRVRQIEVAEVQMAIARQMTQHVERVKAAFPQGVGEDTLNAALAEDPAWQELEAQAKAQADLAQQVWEACRDAIRARMLEQDRAEQDVQAGRAKAVDKPLHERIADDAKKE